MPIILKEKVASGLTKSEIVEAIMASLEARDLKKVLLVGPDFTRFHSNAGFIINQYYHLLRKSDVEVDIMPALGTHVPMTEEECLEMYGDIPFEKF